MGVLITSLSEGVKVPKVLSNWIAFVLEWLVLVAVTTLAVGFINSSRCYRCNNSSLC